VETPAELPTQDAVLICVKNGNLPEVAQQIAPIVGLDTIVLTVMNGVTAGAALRKALGGGRVLESVIYTVSSAGPDFSITQTGNFVQLFTGAVPGDEAGAAAAGELAAVLQGAGIECHLSPDVRTAIWSKFVLNCAYNVATARWGCPVGGIKADPARLEDCRALMTEARQVGLAMGVSLPEDLVDKQLHRIVVTSDPSTSSLSRDFAAGRAGELEVFSGDVVRMAAEQGVPVPVMAQYYAALLEIAAGFSK
jgi:2-dehydropantoate 2-reductase